LVQAVNIGPQLLFLFRLGQAVGAGGKGQAGQHVPVRVGLLGLHRRRLLGLFHNVVDQAGGIADFARNHGGLHIGLFPDDAADVEFEGVVVEVFQARFALPQVGVEAGGLVVAVAGGGENHTEIAAADLLIAPLVLSVGGGGLAVGQDHHL